MTSLFNFWNVSRKTWWTISIHLTPHLTMMLSRRDLLCLLVLIASAAVLATNAFSAQPFAVRTSLRALRRPKNSLFVMASDNDGQGRGMTKAPTLNGKMILPFKVMASGLKNHQIAAVYAVLNSQYKRGSGDGWEYCEYVGVTRNLEEALNSHLAKQGKDAVAHVRALSFSYPQQTAMEEVALQWRKQVNEAGGSLQQWVGEDFFDDDEEDEEEEEDWLMETAPPAVSSKAEQPIVSPFSSGAETPVALAGDKLALTRENVDKVLEEVRPYLISDGGNVAVDRVDEVTKNVYLVLEGACGSCASSTVTMKMGIERVLKENFPDLGEVVQVEDPNANPTPTELTWEAVEAEVNRIKPAIVAMGGVVKIKSVDPIGVVELEFRGGNKVKQGLELAIQDVPYVKHVKFVM